MRSSPPRAAQIAHGVLCVCHHPQERRAAYSRILRLMNTWTQVCRSGNKVLQCHGQLIISALRPGVAHGMG